MLWHVTSVICDVKRKKCKVILCDPVSESNRKKGFHVWNTVKNVESIYCGLKTFNTAPGCVSANVTEIKRFPRNISTARTKQIRNINSAPTRLWNLVNTYSRDLILKWKLIRQGQTIASFVKTYICPPGLDFSSSLWGNPAWGEAVGGAVNNGQF